MKFTTRTLVDVDAAAARPFRLQPRAAEGHRANRPRRVATVQLRSSALEKWVPATLQETLALIDVWTVTRRAEEAAFPETGGRPPQGGCRVKVRLADLQEGSRGVAEKMARELRGEW